MENVQSEQTMEDLKLKTDQTEQTKDKKELEQTVEELELKTEQTEQTDLTIDKMESEQAVKDLDSGADY